MVNIEKELQSKKDPIRAKILSRFFKTGKGQYGEGDIFLGIVVPIQRAIAKKYKDVSLKEIQKLLDSKIHEYRLTGLLVLVEKYKEDKELVYNFYIKNFRNINNWDLVDLTAPKIMGDFLKDKKKDILYSLAISDDLWERRISIIVTFAFIKDNDFKDALKISKILLNDKHDLIHKAVGWMLREVGKRNKDFEKEFLDKYYRIMPRTMLRYSIEKFDPKEKEFYMKK
ncbi:MAG TPA: DNA alkylation repair protein [Candidatus Pacearchaeota archaeon]|nr:DNA alkylation repair protein [Candidatus Pacearchaeota archaeon]HQB18783.1 DNA alkylation repair protein [Candidatus Pacearchaeota archaeon]